MPLIVKPSYRSIVNFFSNYDIVENLLLNYHNKGTKFNFKDIENEIMEQLNDNHSHQLTNESSKDYLISKLSSTEVKHSLYNVLKFLAKEHFEFIRGRNVLKTDEIETFQFLNNSIDVNPIYSMAVSRSIKQMNHNERIAYLKYKTDNNIIEYPKRFSFLESFSDNHFHLGGANSFAYRLHKILQNPLSLDQTNIPQNKTLKALHKKVDFKIIAYGTSILEQMIFSYILRNSHNYRHYKGIDYTHVFQKQFQTFAKGMINQDVQTIKKIEISETYYNHNNKEKIRKSDIPSLLTIRPKGNIQDISPYTKNDYFNTLIAKVIKNNQQHNIQKADKILWVLMCEIMYTHQNPILKDAIYVYIVLRNILHSLIVQQQKQGGLRYFSSYSQSSLRRAKKDYEFIDSFRSILSSSFKMNIEGRINMQYQPEKYAEEMAKWVSAFDLVNKELENNSKEKNNLSFMFHFQKKEEVEKITKKPIYTKGRYHNFRKEIFKQSKALMKFMKSSKYRKYDAIEQTDIKKRKKYDLISYISGIDAASKEDKVPPEVFAPIYRYIRNSIELSMIPFENAISINQKLDNTNKLFQFSYHVGEEFKDLTTGIRNIFEAIVFLGFRKGDRLGHALALGMSPQKYFQKHKITVTSTEEQFDNAVFGYYLLDSFSEDHTLKYDFYQKAMKFGSNIYRGDYTMDNYINAWLLRRNSPTNLQKFMNTYWSYSKNDKYKHITDPNEKIKLYELFKLEGEICAFASESEDDHAYLHNDDFLLTLKRVMHEDKFYFKMSLPDIFNIKLPFEDKVCTRYEWAQKDPKAWELLLRYNFDTEVKKRGSSKIDAKPYKANYIEVIQDIIMEELIAKRDIIIEVMPTSNILNSDLESYRHHPMFRFKPVGDLKEFNNFNIRNTKLRTIISTDNPGFQATSYINELFLILQAGIKRGYSSEKMESYLKEIIELGNYIYSGQASQE